MPEPPRYDFYNPSRCPCVFGGQLRVERGASVPAATTASERDLIWKRERAGVAHHFPFGRLTISQLLSTRVLRPDTSLSRQNTCRALELITLTPYPTLQTVPFNCQCKRIRSQSFRGSTFSIPTKKELQLGAGPKSSL